MPMLNFRLIRLRRFVANRSMFRKLFVTERPAVATEVMALIPQSLDQRFSSEHVSKCRYNVEPTDA